MSWARQIRPVLALSLLLSIGNARADEPMLTYPAIGFWNGFLKQTNVIECANFGSDTVEVDLAIRNQFGSELARRALRVEGLTTKHIILNEMIDVRDRYGTYRLGQIGTQPLSQLRCETAIYRFSSTPARVVDYAYVLPVKEFIRGNNTGLYNSMNPSGREAPVFNWLSIYNPNNEVLQTRLRLYDLRGVETSEMLLRIPPGERQDVPLGHNNELNGGQHVGLYQIEPSDSNAQYAAYLVRYGPSAHGYNFAFPLYPGKGSAETSSVFAATVNNAFNWAEVANTASTECALRLKVNDRSGRLLSSTTVTLPPLGEYHFFLNSALGRAGLGTFEVEPLCEGAQILLQNLYYGFSSQTSELLWAYAAQDEHIRGNDRQRQGFFANTFLGMANWLKVSNGVNEGGVHRVDSYTAAGLHSKEALLALASAQATDVPLHEWFGGNAVGLAYVSSTSDHASAQAELLRVFLASDNSVASVMYIPPVLLPEPVASVHTEVIARGLNSPVALTHAGDGSGRLFIAEREGRIRILQENELLSAPFLDISHKVSTEGEMGLLSIAFHPNYASNRKFYVVYSESNFDTVLSEFETSLTNSNLGDATSERELLRIPQPHYFHKGGQLAFGRDGYMYFSVGDGGLPGDATGNAQNLSSLLGKILRIDISVFPYAIPPDNPFYATRDARPEIWAYGFRNPWRFSFDRVSGELFVGDVGENRVEEIDLIQRGGNYGWNFVEGDLCFPPSTSCNRNETLLPISSYTHAEGLAVVGGSVYRGREISSLIGKYLFADYVSGRLWAIGRSERGAWIRSQLTHENYYISAMGEDETGEIYLVNFFGALHKLRRE